MVKRLERDLFDMIVENTPLISIDLIVKNNEGEVLLGQRRNRPAQDFWFVPGGRIFKDESFEMSFKRIVTEELGTNFLLENATFLGVFEHFYNDSFAGNDFSTHYVVHGFEIHVQVEQLNLSNLQHNAYNWFDVESLLESPSVHQYTKNYFTPR